jgi:hypothetical protein
MSEKSQFPILYGRRIKNTGDFKHALMTVSADVVAGRITPKEGNAINREAREILKLFKAAVSARSLSYGASE